MSEQGPDEQTAGTDRITRRLALQTTAGIGIGSLTGLASVGGVTARGSEASATDAQQDATEITDWFDLDEVRNDLRGEYVLTTDLDENTAGYEEVVTAPTTNEFTERQGGQFSEGDTVTLVRTPVEAVSATDFDGNPIEVELTDSEAGTVEFRETPSEDSITAIFEYTITEDQFVGFNPIGGELSASGTPTPSFAGTFDGQGNEIRGLRIDRNQNVGLFGAAEGEVTNIGVVGVEIRGRNIRVGGVAGRSFDGEITESYATGTISGGRSGIGGLVGIISRGTIAECYATADVEARFSGGLVGVSSNATITESYATGAVTDTPSGGLIGFSAGSTVTDSYATGSVAGGVDTGGLIGVALAETTVVQDSYWDTETTGQTDAAGDMGSLEIEGDVRGLETAQMQGEAARDNLSVFDFEDTWRAVTDPADADYPDLRWQVPVVTGDARPQDRDDDGNYEDITGDGELTVTDVQVFFENYRSDVIQDNVERFNFSGDDSGNVTLADVQALYQQLTE